MSKTERWRNEVFRKKDLVYHRDGGVCRFCGEIVPYPGDLAHIIPQTKSKAAMYGGEVIHHSYNLALVCSRRPRCNDGMSIGYDPEGEKELVGSIEQAIKKGIE